jgi:hypothetical protein
MPMGIEDKIICLCLNKRWQPIGVKSVRDAFSELVHPNCVALNVIYKKNEDGSLNFSDIEDIQAVKWDEWLTLPVRECDLEIRTSKMSIRVPTIIASDPLTVVVRGTGMVLEDLDSLKELIIPLDIGKKPNINV